jgi:excisionase family DNA binding protein
MSDAIIPIKRPRGRPKGTRNRSRPPETQPVIKPAAMRIETAASYLDQSVSTVRRLIKEGHLETARIGMSVLVLTRSADRLLEAGMKTPSRVPAKAQSIERSEPALADKGEPT